jgi:hypothetical protein
VSDSDRQSSIADFESTVPSDLNRSLNYSFGMSCVIDGNVHLDASNGSWLNPVMDICEKQDLERCIEAMNFIPVVSSVLGLNDTDGVMVFQSRVAILTPVLTACYARHGRSALIAVEGLLDLLRETSLPMR